jgi:hypothetical protein
MVVNFLTWQVCCQLLELADDNFVWNVASWIAKRSNQQKKVIVVIIVAVNINTAMNTHADANHFWLIYMIKPLAPYQSTYIIYW